MDDENWLAERFEEHRPQLRAVAYRMLGSFAAADDAVQDAWVRASRAQVDEIENMRAWLTTIVARVCLNALRSRRSRGEEAAGSSLPDPVVTGVGAGPEEEAVTADSVGIALLVVLETLSPAERLAFVLHDLFGLRFEEIAPVLGRTVQATRQVASRARRRVRGADPDGIDRDPARERTVVDAFFAAGRAGDFEALVAVLDPDVLLRADFGPDRRDASGLLRGSAAVARRAQLGAKLSAEVVPVLVNGAAGAVIVRQGVPIVLFAFTVRGDRIVEIDSIGEPDRVARLVAPVLRRHA